MPRQSRKVGKQMTDGLDKLVSQFAVALTKGLTEDTPKDTGFASINWIPTIGAPFSGTAGNRVDAEYAGILRTEVQQKQLRVIRRYKSSMGPLYITNNVKYIRDLNNGTSSQAPSAFIQKRIERTKALFRGKDISVQAVF